MEIFPVNCKTFIGMILNHVKVSDRALNMVLRPLHGQFSN